MFVFCGKGTGFHFQSMLLQRETVHSSALYPDLMLHLTEVQDLNVSLDQAGLDYHVGTLQSQNAMVDNHRLWWKIAISSHCVSKILEASADLETGEKARWQPEEVVKTEVVADMYGLAQEIVTQIDHVGIRNQGHATSGSKSTTKLSSYDLPTGPAGYW